MFLIKESKLDIQDIMYELYEESIKFFDDYNNTKEQLILKEHTILLEGNYIEEDSNCLLLQESIMDKISNFIKMIANMFNKAYQWLKQKTIEIINYFRKKFQPNEELKGPDYREEKNLLYKTLDNIKEYVSDAVYTRDKKKLAIIFTAQIAATVAAGYVGLKVADLVSDLNDINRKVEDANETIKRRSFEAYERKDVNPTIVQAYEDEIKQLRELVTWSIKRKSKIIQMIMSFKSNTKMEPISKDEAKLFPRGKDVYNLSMSGKEEKRI